MSYLFLACSEWSLSFDHFVNEAAKAEPVWTKSVLLVVYDLRRHVTNGANPTSDHFALWYLNGQAEVRDTHVAVVIQQNILRFAIAVHDAHCMQVLQAAQNLHQNMVYKKIIQILEIGLLV